MLSLGHEGWRDLRVTGNLTILFHYQDQLAPSRLGVVRTGRLC